MFVILIYHRYTVTAHDIIDGAIITKYKLSVCTLIIIPLVVIYSVHVLYIVEYIDYWITLYIMVCDDKWSHILSDIS